MKNLKKFFLLVLTVLLVIGCKNNPPEEPVKPEPKKFDRTILFEEYTTAVCVNCPAGAQAIHNAMAGNESRIAFIAHHIGYYDDTYTIAASKPFIYFFNDGGRTYAPAMMIDRSIILGKEANTPVFFPGNSGVNTTLVKQMIDNPAYVGVTIDKVEFDPATRKLNVSVSGEFSKSYPNARLTVWLTQDKVYGYQSGGGNDYEHNNMARAVISDGGSFGDNISNGEGDKFSKTYTYTIPQTIIGQGTSGTQTNMEIDCVPENMNVVAVVAEAVGTGTSSDIQQNINDWKVRNAAFKKVVQ